MAVIIYDRNGDDTERYSKSFDEAQHPRDDSGKFTDKDGRADTDELEKWLTPEDKKRLLEYQRQGIPENKIEHIRNTMARNSRDAHQRDIEQSPSPERKAVSVEVAKSLTQMFGKPDSSDLSEAIYWTTGPRGYRIRMASHPPVRNRSASHINIIESGAAHPSFYPLDSVLVTTFNKTPSQVIEEVVAAIEQWKQKTEDKRRAELANL